MIVLRQIMVIALMPVVAWTGMPQVACKCSTGEIRLSCPRLNSASLNLPSQTSTAACCRPTPAASRVNKPAAGCCCCAVAKTQESQHATCSLRGCYCTRIVLAAGDLTITTIKGAASTGMFEFAQLPAFAIHLPQTVQSAVNSFDTGPPPQNDINLVFQRLLI